MFGLFKSKSEKAKEARLSGDMDAVPYFTPQCCKCLQRFFDKGTEKCQIYGKVPEVIAMNEINCPEIKLREVK